MAGIAVVELPLLDNTHACWMDVGVPPEHRGRGIGAALLERVEGAARDGGRTHVLGAAFTPPGAESAGSRFAVARGYDVAHREGLKVLDLRDHSDWAPLDAEVAARIGEYTLVEWREHTPEEHMADLANAISSFFSMVPDRRPGPGGRRVDARAVAGQRGPGRGAQPALLLGCSGPERRADRVHRPPCLPGEDHSGRCRHHVRAARPPWSLARSGPQAGQPPRAHGRPCPSASWCAPATRRSTAT